MHSTSEKEGMCDGYSLELGVHLGTIDLACYGIRCPFEHYLFDMIAMKRCPFGHY